MILQQLATHDGKQRNFESGATRQFIAITSATHFRFFVDHVFFSKQVTAKFFKESRFFLLPPATALVGVLRSCLLVVFLVDNQPVIAS